MEVVAADPQLAEEQERLDRTFALWDKVGPPAAPARIEVARVAVELSPDDVAEVIAEARRRLTYDAGRERFRDRLADRVPPR